MSEICTVCLEVPPRRNRSFGDPCLHVYCFQCLLEWSKVKKECPQCKTILSAIIYDVESNSVFKMHQLSSPPPPQSLNLVHREEDEEDSDEDAIDVINSDILFLLGLLNSGSA
uniref:RING-type E3 ubiquitin transferase n=1 Tax=Lepeophtheirus salmonis TaxID=72036 RepID=D3PIZ8_LEPSM|nr:Trans-acting transcriptional protein ICP0 [Lepeophtheirus salmonis]